MRSLDPDVGSLEFGAGLEGGLEGGLGGEDSLVLVALEVGLDAGDSLGLGVGLGENSPGFDRSLDPVVEGSLDFAGGRGSRLAADRTAGCNSSFLRM